MDLSQYERNYQPMNLPAPVSSQEQKKKKGFLGAIAPFLPAIGAAAGIGLAPFTGGGSLALIGLGAAGGALGKVGANKLEGKGALDNPGQIALEGLFGATGGAGKAFQAARAAKTAATAAKAVDEGADVLNGVRQLTKGADVIEGAVKGANVASEASTAANVGKLTARQRVANALTQKGSGLKVGKNVGGASDLDEAAQTLQRLKISGTPKQQLHAIEQTMAKHGAQVDEILSTKAIPVNGKNVRTAVQSAIDDPLKYADLDLSTPGVQRNLGAHLTKFEGATNAKELNDYIKTLNPIATRAKDKLVRGVALTDKETAALAAKQAGDEVLSVIPEIKPFKKDMAILFSRNAEIAAQHGKAANIPVVGGVLRAPAGAARYAQSKAGQVLAGEGVATAGKEAAEGTIKGNIGKFVKPVVRQSIISGVGNAALAPEDKIDPNEPARLTDEQSMQREQQIADQILGSMTPEARIALANEQAAGGADGGQQDFGDSISPGQLLQMVAADPQNASTYISLYKALESSSGGSTKPMSAEASKVVSNAQAGQEGINDLRSVIANDPGVTKRTLIPGRGLFGGLIGNAVGTNEFEAARQQVVDVIARLRTGAAISKTEEQRFLKFLPQPFDSPAVREQKLGYLQRQFERVAQQNPQAGSDIEAALAGAGAGAEAY